MNGRKAYPGSPLDLMVSHGIGVDHGAAEIANVLVNGRRLGEIMESMRTPNKHDIRPETKYREAFSIAVAAVQMVVNPPDAGKQKETPIPKALLKSAFDVVEMRRLELLTPYMRSKCSTS